MKTLIAGIFTDTEAAGHAIEELNAADYDADVSVVAKKPGDAPDEARSHQVKQDLTDGAEAGAGVAAALGALGGLAASLGVAALPGGIVLLAAGPLTAAWTAGGAAAGALTGGLAGALVDWGIPPKRAEEYEEHIMNGDALVTVTLDDQEEEDEQHAQDTLLSHNAALVGVYEMDD